jgi:hypothetical protein
MTPETWTVILVAAAFLLLGIAISPLGWVALAHRRSRFEQRVEERLRDAADRLRKLEGRLEQFESAYRNQPARDRRAGDSTVPHGPHWPRAASARGKPGEATRTDAASTPTLIAVPSLAAPPSERAASIDGMSHRYAAIWSLADSGTSAELIARATGQPIGQVELILGLRRQIDAGRHKIPHGPHDADSVSP